MKLIGQILMWAGFLAGALATVYNLPSKGVEYAKNLKPDAEQRFELQDLSEVVVPEDGWELIPWTWYIASAVVCLVGVVMIRMGNSASAALDSQEEQVSVSTLKTSLNQLIQNSQKLHNEIGKLAPSKITEFIDTKLANDFRAFADNRETMISQFGLTAYADVMTNFAAGERSANRAWSAAADGYVDEAANCIERSLMLLREALSELNQAEKNGGTA